MKTTAAVVLLLFYCNVLPAQINTDSLKVQIKLGLPLPEKAGLQLRIARTFYLKAGNKAESDSALLYCKRAQETAAASKGNPVADTCYVKALYLEANIARLSNDITGIIAATEKLLPEYQFLPRKHQIGAFILASEVYPLRGDYKKAVAASEMALELSKKYKDREMEVRALIGTINIYGMPGSEVDEKQSVQKMLNTGTKALQIAREINNEDLQDFCMVSLVNIYDELGAYDKVLAMEKERRELASRNPVPYFVPQYAQLAKALHHFKNYASARLNADSAIAVATQYGGFQQVGGYYIMLTEWDLEASNYSAAEAHNDSAAKYLNQYGTSAERQNLLKQRKDILLKTRRFEEAAKVMQQYLDTMAAAFSLENANISKEFEVKMKTKDVELENLTIKEKLVEEKLKAYLMYVLLGAALICGLLLWMNRRNRLRIAKKNHENTRLELLNEQLRSNALETERELMEERHKKAELDLALKSTSLAAVTAQSLQKSELLESVKDNIARNGKLTGEQLKTITSRLDETLDLNKEWETFMVHFTGVHPGFFDRLLQIAPDLTANDLKMAAYTAMNLSGKEISRLLLITDGSVHNARYRLRTKLKLDTESDLYVVLKSI